MHFSLATLFWGFIFSGAGFVIFKVAKTRGNTRLMVLGGIMMFYSYLTPSTTLTLVIGSILSLLAYSWW